MHRANFNINYILKLSIEKSHSVCLCVSECFCVVNSCALNNKIVIRLPYENAPYEDKMIRLMAERENFKNRNIYCWTGDGSTSYQWEIHTTILYIVHIHCTKYTYTFTWMALRPKWLYASKIRIWIFVFFLLLLLGINVVSVFCNTLLYSDIPLHSRINSFLIHIQMQVYYKQSISAAFLYSFFRYYIAFSTNTFAHTILLFWQYFIFDCIRGRRNKSLLSKLQTLKVQEASLQRLNTFPIDPI